MASSGPARLFAALIVATGLGVAGWLVGHGFAAGRAADRWVTVKGISEREVSADLALWPLRLTASNNDLAKAHAQLESSLAKVREFLTREGLDLSESQVQSFSVNDANQREYGGGNASATVSSSRRHWWCARARPRRSRR